MEAETGPELYLLRASPALARRELQPGPRRRRAETGRGAAPGSSCCREITAQPPAVSAPGAHRPGNAKRPRRE